MGIDQRTLCPAYLLHRRAYSNHSLLLECFTPEDGRFPAIARGVKGPKSGKAGLLQPFSPLLVRWSGRGDVKSLTGFEAAGPPLLLAGKRLYCGFYLNELLMRLLQRSDPHPSLFSHYAVTLSGLATEQPLEPTLRRFEFQLLDELGYRLVLDRNVDDDSPLVAEHRYHYVLDRGPVPGHEGDPCLIRGSTLLALHDGQILDSGQLIEARQLSRYVLAYYLGDRPLKSRELFRDLGL